MAAGHLAAHIAPKFAEDIESGDTAQLCAVAAKGLNGSAIGIGVIQISKTGRDSGANEDRGIHRRGTVITAGDQRARSRIPDAVHEAPGATAEVARVLVQDRRQKKIAEEQAGLAARELGAESFAVTAGALSVTRGAPGSLRNSRRGCGGKEIRWRVAIPQENVKLLMGRERLRGQTAGRFRNNGLGGCHQSKGQHRECYGEKATAVQMVSFHRWRLGANS